MRKSDLIQVEQKEVRGMLKITLIVVKNDILIKEVTVSMTFDAIEWQKMICVVGLDKNDEDS